MTLLGDENIRSPIAVALGAIAGALVRYYATPKLTQWGDRLCGAGWGAGWTGFPYGTFVINLSGCFLMGLITALFTVLSASLWSDRVPPELRLLLTTGFLGAYTTFSTYGLEVMALGKGDRWEMALLYAIGSVVGGVLAVAIGQGCGSAIGHWWVSTAIGEK